MTVEQQFIQEYLWKYFNSTEWVMRNEYETFQRVKTSLNILFKQAQATNIYSKFQEYIQDRYYNEDVDENDLTFLDWIYRSEYQQLKSLLQKTQKEYGL